MTIWMNDDRGLIITQYSTIRQDDTNITDILYFICPDNYLDYNVTLYYKLPNDEVHEVVLEPDEELYKGCIKLTLPTAEDFTKYDGNVSMKLVLTKGTETLTSGEVFIEVLKNPEYEVTP